MSLVLSVYPEALQELRYAARWFAQGGQGRGRRFKIAYDAAVERVLEWPQSGAMHEDDQLEVEVRKAKVARSEYWIVYFVENDALNVVAVAHERRKPDYWKDRIR